MSLITRESASFQNGISITSVRMSKGLEFDEVLIPQADSRTYASDFDRSRYILPVHGPCTGLRLPIAERNTIYFRAEAVWQALRKGEIRELNPDGGF